GEDIKEQVDEGVRIDGIQATGLDEEFNLVVDRKPVLGKVARSTPELIVERLSRISSKKGFYNRILDRFR
ncbi:MAG: endonuclease MutS2, partial [Candidatus Hydrothermarchaeales archaeon]